ncbi:MAG: 3,4-dihydroxy-2-butanone-4-phosphate synthase [Deltaproteobacteria bacterium]|nr:3,4-dihydroxy-2-butanone-4-phosphate synthase [Deltaproteobacteria bacterium]
MTAFEPFPSDAQQRVQSAMDDIAAGKMVILVDDESRENEGDLVMAADRATPEAINFMATHGRGLICLTLTPDRIERLDLPMMVRKNDSPYGTAFTVSIEASTGVTTGISAADRARTIEVAVDPDAKAADLVSPGHVFPLRAREGGVLVRAGQTEGSVDLSRLSGCGPAGVICEIMNADGTMARLPQLEAFAREHTLRILTVADLIAWRLRTESQIESVATTKLTTDAMGEVTAHVFRNRVNDLQYLALVKGTFDEETPTLVRVHSSDIWGDALQAFRRDSGPLLHQSMRIIGAAGAGVLMYILRPFDADSVLRGLVAHADPEGIEGDIPPAPRQADPYPTGLRDYGLGAQVLRTLGVRRIRLLTNSARRLVGVEGYGLEVVERVSVPVDAVAELAILPGGRG